MKNRVTAARLRELLSFDPATGEFTWIGRSGSGHSKPLGKKAGCNVHGYIAIRINGVRHAAHRLAWLYVYGDLPSGVIDHINGDPTDNRIANLRDVSAAVNRQNIRRPAKHSSTGYLGVRRIYGGRFKAVIDHNKKRVTVGCFETAEAAHNAYLNAKRQLHAGCTI